PFLMALAQSWLIWVRANADDWNAVADLPRAEALLETVLRIDETYADGSAHVYLGMLKTVRPPALGGKPEEARRHFEQAIRLSGGANLGAKVALAENYARVVFDRELHDALLRDVLAAPSKAEGQTLMNVLAQQRAQELLSSANDYYGEVCKDNTGVAHDHATFAACRVAAGVLAAGCGCPDLQDRHAGAGRLLVDERHARRCRGNRQAHRQSRPVPLLSRRGDGQRPERAAQDPHRPAAWRGLHRGQPCRGVPGHQRARPAVPVPQSR